MALYFYFNATTKDLVYSDKATYKNTGYTSLGEQTNMSPRLDSDWIFDSRRSRIATVTKDTAVTEKITGLTSMAYMFSGCTAVTNIDLSGFNTSQVTMMNHMFANCYDLVSLDLSGFDTSQVTTMDNIFGRCSSLVSLDLSNFNTSKMTSLFYMFGDCTSLTNLNLSSFDTSQIIRADSMFKECSSLISLDLSGFNTSKVENINDMFNGCSSLVSLDLSSFNTSQVTAMDNVFNNCSSLRLITISDDMSNVLPELPVNQYHSAVDGNTVTKKNLTAGTWVRDEADLSMVTSIVEQAQMSQAISRRIGKLNRDLRAEIAKASAGSATPSVDVVRTEQHQTSYDKDTLEIVTDSTGKVTEMYFVSA